MSAKNKPTKYTEEFKKNIVSLYQFGKTPNTKGIRRFLVNSVQLDPEVFPGEDRR